MIVKRMMMLITAAVVAAACGSEPTAAERTLGDAAPGMNHVTSYISGPVYVTCSGFHEYDSNPGGGSTYTYAWTYQPYNDGNWYSLGNERTAMQWIDVGDPHMDLRVDVTSGGHTSTSYLRVYGPTTNDIC